jgi:glycosyltransferase involved in cell wall biosynthesis
MPRVLIVRGHLVTPWELRPWRDLPDRFDVEVLKTGSNSYSTADVGLREVPVRALRDRLPKGILGEVPTGLMGDRSQGADAVAAFAGADIVHAEELSFWFAADAAKRRAKGNFKLVQTVWETIPFLSTYRNRHARQNREQVLAHTDLFLPATERAREALLIEGVPEAKLLVCPPGIDTTRFAATTSTTATAAAPDDEDHVILSPGRLVWEKGHQDVLRAVAALHRGIVTRPDGSTVRPRVLIVGSGPEENRLKAYAAELGLAAHVDFRSVPYDEMPQVFARASAMVLASQSAATAAVHLFDIPRAFWEEQFGLVLAEAMAARLDIVAAANGAIPEVLDGTGTLVQPGDWMQIAKALASGALTREPGARVDYPATLVERYSTAAMASRLADAYDRVLAS